MPAKILDGSAYAAEIRSQVHRDVAHFTTHHGPIRLCAILVGSDEGGRLYARWQRKRCVQTGAHYELVELPESTTQAELLAQIDRLNADPLVTGIILQLPLPAGIDDAAAQYRIDPYKDVEGVNPANIGLLFYGEPIIAPCTALAVLEMLRGHDIPLPGKHVVIVGRSTVVGKPLANLLLRKSERGNATVTVCHTGTVDVAAHARQADIVVAAMGRPGAIRSDMITEGAVVVDVGTNQIDDPGSEKGHRLVGDVAFDEMIGLASAVTPVPGGVGTLTTALLLRSVVVAAENAAERKAP